MIISHLVPVKSRVPKCVRGYPLELGKYIGEGLRVLCIVCRISRQFRDIAQPLLYRVALAECNERLMLLVRTLSERPELATEIRTVVWLCSQLGKAPPAEGDDKWSPDSDPPRRLVVVEREYRRGIDERKDETFTMTLPRLPERFERFDGKVSVDVQVGLETRNLLFFVFFLPQT